MRAILCLLVYILASNCVNAFDEPLAKSQLFTEGFQVVKNNAAYLSATSSVVALHFTKSLNGKNPSLYQYPSCFINYIFRFSFFRAHNSTF